MQVIPGARGVVRSPVLSRPRKCAGRGPLTCSASKVQGGTTEKRCDQCLGKGVVDCFVCNTAEILGFQPEVEKGKKARTKGYVAVRQFGFFGDIVSEKPCTRCNAKGVLTCPRCRGAKKLVFRSAEWK